jgi:signal transduction histidine kinase
VLRKQEILEAVARLAGGVAHESNNQMSVVLGLSSFILQREDLPESLREDVSRIHAAAERTAAMTRELLAFSRKQLLQPRTLDLNSSIDAISPALQRALGDSIELQLKLAPGLPPIRFDQRQLEQVLLQLVVNARDAMPEGGRLSLVTRVVVASEPLGSAEPVTIRPGRYVELVVWDSGPGMDTETLTHVFEPFYTTKEMGLGAGLGLASVYGIVKQSGGYVFAESSPGQGSRFRILLPAAMDVSQTEAVSQTEGV